MRKLLSTLTVTLLILSVIGAPVFAQDSRDICSELSGSVTGLVGEGRATGVVLSIVQHGEIRLCTGFGFADKFNGIAADGEKTAFRIGSVSKTFVAVAAQILAQEGRLDMGLDISGYLEPDFPALSYPVTMHQLLTHTAGFEDRVTGMAVFNVSDTEPLAESVRQYRPAQIFRPSEVTSYSNYGLALAAYVVERVAGQDFAGFCRENIFLPLGMKRTTFAYMHNVPYVSKPYLPSGQETVEPYINLYPEGSAVSTAEDMANYMQWLLNKGDTRVLSAQAKEELFGRQFSLSADLAGVGYTWNRKERNDAVYYDKKGETLHFYSRIALYPREQTGIFLSFNTYLPEHEINAVMNKATDLLYGEALQAGPGSFNATMDISGCYVNNWSSFQTAERILRYIVPGKILTIEGTISQGFSLNAERLSLIGEDMYSSPLGVLKFLKRDGKIIIATESAITFTRIPFWQHSGLQVLPPLLFVVFALACFLRELILLLHKKSAERRIVFLICPLAQLLAFGVLCLLLYNGIVSFSLLSYALPLKLCGWLIFAASVAGLADVAYLKAKYGCLKPIPAAWNLACLLFCAWMVGMNIL